KQFGAVAKFLELKMRAFGLLRDKLDVNVTSHIDIGSALDDARSRALQRPMRDLPVVIDAESVGAHAPQLNGPIDLKSTVRPRGDDGGSFFEAGMYD
ncbi:hypothetical protein N7T98_26380, partial [Pseudomonas syringae pv. tomato]